MSRKRQKTCMISLIRKRKKWCNLNSRWTRRPSNWNDSFMSYKNSVMLRTHALASLMGRSACALLKSNAKKNRSKERNSERKRSCTCSRERCQYKIKLERPHLQLRDESLTKAWSPQRRRTMLLTRSARCTVTKAMIRLVAANNNKRLASMVAALMMVMLWTTVESVRLTLRSQVCSK
jgi:hypothetical protein